MNSAIILILLSVFLDQTVFVTGQRRNIWEIVNSDERLTTLAKAIKAADLDEATQNEGSYTVFAPNDAAFAKVPSDVVERLVDPQNKDELVEVLSYHAVAKALTSADLIGMSLPARIETLVPGDFITVSKQANEVKINDATVIVADILASNGVIHIIDGVLQPTLRRN